MHQGTIDTKEPGERKKGRRDGRHLLLETLVCEAITSMENGEVIDVLDVALLKVGRDAELLAEEMEGVERLGLGLRDGGYRMPAGKLSEAHKVPPRIL